VQLDVPDGWRVNPALRPLRTRFRSADHRDFRNHATTTMHKASCEQPQHVGDRKISLATEVYRLSAHPHPDLASRSRHQAGSVRHPHARAQHRIHSSARVMKSPRPSARWAQPLCCFSPSNLTTGDLSQYDAIVTGVRAWNTRADLRANYQRLFDYGARRRHPHRPIQRFPRSGRSAAIPHCSSTSDRCRSLSAAIASLSPKRRRLRFPSPAEFAGCTRPIPSTRAISPARVQEARPQLRAKRMGPSQYQSVLESHDQGEEPHPGGELYLRLGKGVYISPRIPGPRTARRRRRRVIVLICEQCSAPGRSP